MAFGNAESFWSAETQDVTGENLTGNITMQTARVQTGGYGYDFNFTLTGESSLNTQLGNLVSGGQILVFSAALGVDVAPTSAIGLLTDFDRGEGGGHKRYIRIGTDRTIQIFDKNGNKYGPSSTTTIPTTAIGGMQEVHVVFDGLTLSTVFVKVYFGGTEELAFDTGQTPSNFFATGANTLLAFGDNPTSSYGAHVYMDDLITRSSTTASDAPHLLAYPRLRGNGLIQTPPTANGTYTAWTSTGCASGSEYLCVDDTGGNDGDTTYVSANIAVGGTNIAHTFTYSAANPVPVGATIEFVNLQVTAKTGSGSKNAGANFRLRLGGTDSDSGQLGQALSYQGDFSRNVARPGGGSWTRTDSAPTTLQFGAITAATGSLGANPFITLYGGPLWVYYTATLPLGTTPSSAVVTRKRRMLTGIGL